MAKKSKEGKDKKKKGGKGSKGNKTDASTEPSEPIKPKYWRDLIGEMELSSENFNYNAMLLVESSDKCCPIVDNISYYIKSISQCR